MSTSMIAAGNVTAPRRPNGNLAEGSLRLPLFTAPPSFHIVSQLVQSLDLWILHMNWSSARLDRRINVDVVLTFTEPCARGLTLAHEEGKVKGNQARVTELLETFVGPLGLGSPPKDALNVDCLVDEGNRVRICWTPFESTFHDSIRPQLEKKREQLRSAAEDAKHLAEATAARAQARLDARIKTLPNMCEIALEAAGLSAREEKVAAHAGGFRMSRVVKRYVDLAVDGLDIPPLSGLLAASSGATGLLELEEVLPQQDDCLVSLGDCDSDKNSALVWLRFCVTDASVSASPTPPATGPPQPSAAIVSNLPAHLSDPARAMHVVPLVTGVAPVATVVTSRAPIVPSYASGVRTDTPGITLAVSNARPLGPPASAIDSSIDRRNADVEESTRVEKVLQPGVIDQGMPHIRAPPAVPALKACLETPQMRPALVVGVVRSTAQLSPLSSAVSDIASKGDVQAGDAVTVQDGPDIVSTSSSSAAPHYLAGSVTVTRSRIPASNIAEPSTVISGPPAFRHVWNSPAMRAIAAHVRRAQRKSPFETPLFSERSQRRLGYLPQPRPTRARHDEQSRRVHEQAPESSSSESEQPSPHLKRKRRQSTSPPLRPPRGKRTRPRVVYSDSDTDEEKASSGSEAHQPSEPVTLESSAGRDEHERRVAAQSLPTTPVCGPPQIRTSVPRQLAQDARDGAPYKPPRSACLDSEDDEARKAARKRIASLRPRTVSVRVNSTDEEARQKRLASLRPRTAPHLRQPNPLRSFLDEVEFASDPDDNAPRLRSRVRASRRGSGLAASERMSSAQNLVEQDESEHSSGAASEQPKSASPPLPPVAEETAVAKSQSGDAFTTLANVSESDDLVNDWKVSPTWAVLPETASSPRSQTPSISEEMSDDHASSPNLDGDHGRSHNPALLQSSSVDDDIHNDRWSPPLSDEEKTDAKRAQTSCRPRAPGLRSSPGLGAGMRIGGLSMLASVNETKDAVRARTPLTVNRPVDARSPLRPVDHDKHAAGFDLHTFNDETKGVVGAQEPHLILRTRVPTSPGRDGNSTLVGSFGSPMCDEKGKDAGHIPTSHISIVLGALRSSPEFDGDGMHVDVLGLPVSDEESRDAVRAKMPRIGTSGFPVPEEDTKDVVYAQTSRIDRALDELSLSGLDGDSVFAGHLDLLSSNTETKDTVRAKTPHIDFAREYQSAVPSRPLQLLRERKRPPALARSSSQHAPAHNPALYPPSAVVVSGREPHFASNIKPRSVFLEGMGSVVPASAGSLLGTRDHPVLLSSDEEDQAPGTSLLRDTAVASERARRDASHARHAFTSPAAAVKLGKKAAHRSDHPQSSASRASSSVPTASPAGAGTLWSLPSRPLTCLPVERDGSVAKAETDDATVGDPPSYDPSRPIQPVDLARIKAEAYDASDSVGSSRAGVSKNARAHRKASATPGDQLPTRHPGSFEPALAPDASMAQLPARRFSSTHSASTALGSVLQGDDAHGTSDETKRGLPTTAMEIYQRNAKTVLRQDLPVSLKATPGHVVRMQLEKVRMQYDEQTGVMEEHKDFWHTQAFELLVGAQGPDLRLVREEAGALLEAIAKDDYSRAVMSEGI